MGSGEWGVGSGEWGVGSGEWGVGSGEWGVGSGEWGVGSGEWGVGHFDTEKNACRTTHPRIYPEFAPLFVTWHKARWA